LQNENRFFRATQIKTDCDVCRLHFDLMTGGVCEKCRRVLCSTHLHGSLIKRILADVTGRNICVDCRRG
jgi:methionyl-tRNA synthetase